MLRGSHELQFGLARLPEPGEARNKTFDDKAQVKFHEDFGLLKSAVKQLSVRLVGQTNSLMLRPSGATAICTCVCLSTLLQVHADGHFCPVCNR